MNDPNNIEKLLQEGLALHRQSRLGEAQARYVALLQLQPQHARAWHLLGVIALQTNRQQQALEFINRSIANDPSNPAVHKDLGKALSCLGEHQAAVAAHDHALALASKDAESHGLRANALYELKRYEEALLSYQAAVAIDPAFAGGHYNVGVTLSDLMRHEAAIGAFDQAIALNPAHARAHNHRGNALFDLGLLEDALQSYGNAIALQTDYAEAHNNRGNALFELRRHDAALACFDAAIALQPNYADAHNNRGNLLYKLGQFDAALTSYDAALALQPNYAGVHFNQAQILTELGAHAVAVDGFDRALALKPDFNYALGARLLARRQICDWRNHDADLANLEACVQRGERVATPFAMLALSGSAARQKEAAQIWIRSQARSNQQPAFPPRRQGRDKIRVGYFSADFHNHPIAWLTAELYELHDRSKFDLTAFSYGPDKRDDMRLRLENTFDQFIDVRDKSDTEIVELSRRLKIDIAVDLTGLTKHCRPGIFSRGAAPVQVSYLGYLGTTGAPTMDYLIADHTIIPPHLRPHFVESIVYLPSYQANDSTRVVAERVYARQELGLPETGFVFCCFNANYKFSPLMFDVWMRILKNAPDAVLFLYAESDTARLNLRQEAINRGVDADRLVFGGRLPIADYLVRYKSADLFLDTLPYNAGTTASDALWAGLPVLTCMGETFAGRVASSLLHAIGLPELIASTLTEYEEKAIALATDPDAMADIRQRMTERRHAAPQRTPLHTPLHTPLRTPLFDARLHTRTLEGAYTRMCARYDAGLPPEDIAI